MSYLRRVYLLLVVLGIVIALSAGTSAAQTPEEAEPLGEEALAQDAKMYASDLGIDLDEAIRRLKFQEAVGDLDANLTVKEQDTFAGLWIQHTPRFRVIVQFTHGGEEAIRPYIEAGPLADIVEVRAAGVSLEDLRAARDTALLAVRELDIPMDSGINVFENRVELYVTERSHLNVALRKAGIQLPANVEVVTVDELSHEVVNIYAGLALSQCTSGFSVKNASGTKGITTAGHCDNALTYNGTNLPFQSGTWGGSYDVQWHTAPGFTVRNLAWDGTWNRYVYSTKHRNNQALNEFVCKYGKTTLGGCGYIIDKNFNGTFIRVHRNGVDLASPGDSGGPWFSGNTAYGIMTGEINGSDAYYMAINYIDILGLTVLTN